MSIPQDGWQLLTELYYIHSYSTVQECCWSVQVQSSPAPDLVFLHELILEGDNKLILYLEPFTYEFIIALN